MYKYRLYEIVKGTRQYVSRYDKNIHTGGDSIVYTDLIKRAQIFESDELIKDSVVVKFGSLLHYEWIIGNTLWVIE